MEATKNTNLNIFQVAQMIAELNEQQREAAITIDGRYLVIAGAGSGKTKTLTTRIANMIANNIRPENIFCATFTNKAAREMQERLEAIVGTDNMNNVWMGTFHSLCVRILRKHAHLLGYGQRNGYSNFIVYDSDDVANTIERIYKFMGIEGRYKTYVASSYIDNAKNNLWDPEYTSYHLAETNTEQVMSQVYFHYQRMMLEANAMDFGDLIMNVVLLLENYEDVRNYWQSRFTHVMADEYQDTNPSQFALLKLLSDPHSNIFVVGDPDQSIYRFRGSDISIIMDFEKHFSPCTVIKLERNYRSTNVIVEAGNGLISNNPAAYDKVLRTDKEDGEEVDIVTLTNEYTEAAYVAAKIKELVVSKKYDWGDFAILYRAGYQSMPFEQVFVHNFIPHRILTGKGFLDREEVKDISSYLRVIYNQKDDAAMLRILNKPTRGIGQTTQDAIEVYATNHQVSIHRSLKSVDNINDVKKAAAGKIKTFLSTIEHLQNKLETSKDLSSFVRYVLEQSGLFILYRERAEKEKDGHERLENLEEFISLVSNYEKENPDNSLDDFLQDMSLISDYQKEGEEDPNVVKLLTMHGSKGLEFPYVFNVGWNEGVFPSWRSKTPSDVEEERRLAYVGITRAEKNLTITTTKQRSRADGKGLQNYESSRFISEIPEAIVNKTEI